MDSKLILDIFKEITRIPRESGHEEPMTQYLLDWAAKHSLESKVDATGNVCITKPAAPGKENVPTLVLQSHQDMVCEKNAGVEHDFAKDPVNYVIEDGWMIAKETTLGADDGIGIAASLAVLESDLPTGKIECIFTISEETGMDGAFAMEEGFFTGKTLINLDSEDEGQLFIGCAGGMHTDAEFTFADEPVSEGATRVKLVLGGAMGGHSGDDINKERVNTVAQMARFLYSEMCKGGLQIVKINGGGKSNAIARECMAAVATTDPDGLEARFQAFGKELQAEYRLSDPELVYTSERKSGCACPAIDADAAKRIVSALFACPHGVQAMSQDIKGLVETSTNLASVKTDKDAHTVHIVTSQRSSIVSACHMIAAKVRACFELAGAVVEHSSEYPGWKPNVDSHILEVSKASYKRLFGQDPLVLAIHAGLECGLFLDKFPGLDMISFGPTLRGVHAPGEKLELASLDRFVAHLEDVVTSFE